MRVKYFLIILITIIIFLGCGGGGGGSGVGREIVTGQISGNISFDNMLASERAIIAENADSFRAASFNQAVVFLEEMPTRAVYPDLNGNYCFTDLPLDMTYHVIARIDSLTGKTFKVRSNAVLIESTQPQVVKNFYVSSSDEAKCQVRLQINDTKDNPVGRCHIWLWGEEFTVDESGCYVSPLMPIGSVGKMKVIPPENRDLITLECDIDSSTFQSEIKGVSSVTLPPSGIVQKRAPYASVRVGELLPGGSTIKIYGSAVDPQNDYLGYEWTTNVSSFTYISFDKSYVEWAIPSEPTNAVITFKAKQLSSTLYPLLYSFAELYIKISKDGEISFPGEIVIVPTTRSIDIISSATAQITGDTLALYEAVASFPNELDIVYSWECTEGNVESGKYSRKAFWHSPILKAYESRVATLTCFASDGIATISKALPIKVTSFPTVVISHPVDSEFYPGEVTFSGFAKDYLGNVIDSSVFEWYVATSTEGFQFVQSGVASFTYNFIMKGQYSVALNAPDVAGIVASDTKEISILNCRPSITILSPEDDSGYLRGQTVVFNADITDYEEGKITDSARITWTSDIDNQIGSGTYFEIASLSKGMHTITVNAVDNDGSSASASVVIWYDMPARITLKPENGSVYFDNSIYLEAKGVDEGNKPLDVSTYKWFLDGSDWGKNGIGSFTASELAAGLHSVKVTGRNKAVDVVSANYGYHVGYPIPVVTSPASGTRFNSGDSIHFVAEPQATGTLNFNWFVDGSLNPIGSSTAITATLPDGRHHIEYRGTDAAGKTLCGSTTIVVEDLPTVAIDVASGSKFFATHPIAFNATADVPDSNVSWYIDNSDVPIKTGKNISLSQNGVYRDIYAGYHTISAVAVGEYGSVASISIGFTAGIEAVDIIKPTGRTFSLDGVPIAFQAKPVVDNFPLKWYLNGQEWTEANCSFNHTFTTSGIYKIKLIGTDSADIASFKEIELNIGYFPVMGFVIIDSSGAEIDPEGKVFFRGTDLTLRGSGYNPVDNNPISGYNMSWFIYDNNDNPTQISPEGTNNSQLIIPADVLAPIGEGFRKIELRGKATPSSEAYGSTIKQAYINLLQLTIDKPENNKIIPLDDTLEYSQVFIASGSPVAVSPLKFEWWLNWGTADAKKLTDANNSSVDSGSVINLSIASGSQYLTFVATDSAGFVSYKTRKLIISNNAAIAFIPEDGSVVFANQPFSMLVNDTVVSNSIQWLYKYNGLEGQFTPKGSPYDWNITRLSNFLSDNYGYYEITASGVTSLGVPASITNKIYYGLADAKITSPESGLRFALGSAQNFVATPTAETTYEIRAQNSAWYLDGNRLTGFNDIAAINTTFPGGNHRLEYIATDSVGNQTSSSINVLFDDIPVIGFAAPADVETDLYVFATNKNFSITGSGTVSVEPEINVTCNYKWYLNDDFSVPVEGNTIYGDPLLGNSLSFLDGENTVTVSGEDQFGVVGTHAQKIYYNEDAAVINNPIDGEIFSFDDDIICDGNTSPHITKDWFLNGVLYDAATSNCTISKTELIPGKNYISYIGTDSFGFESVASVCIIIEDKPIMQINTKLGVPADNAVFFQITSGNMRFLGSGVDGLNGDAIANSKMVWKLYYGSDTNSDPIANYTGLIYDIPYAKFESSGYYTLTLTGEDSFGNKGTKTSTFYYGYSLPEIIIPDAVATYSINEGINTGIHLQAYSDPGLITEFPENWIASWSCKNTTTNVVADIGIGKELSSATFATASRYLVTYAEIDSNGTMKSDSSNILIDDDPTVNIKTNLNAEADGAIYYKIDNGNITLRSNIVSECPIKSYLWKLYPGSDTTTGNFDTASTQNYGMSYSKLNGNMGLCTAELTVCDIYGANSSSVATFYYGLEPPTISSPSAYLQLPIAAGASGVELAGAIDTRLSGSAKWFDGTTDITNSIDNVVLAPGSHVITFIATDSNNVEKHSTVKIDVNDKPSVSIKNKTTGTDVAGSVYFILGDSETIQLQGAGTAAIGNTPISSDKMKWTLYTGEGDAGTGKAISGNSEGVCTLTRSSFSGASFYTIKLEVEDSLGFTNASIQSFYYGCALPQIVQPTRTEFRSAEGRSGIYFEGTPDSSSNIAFSWSFSDSTSATGNSTTKIFNTSNTYTATYKGTDSAGRLKSASKTVLVNDLPIIHIQKVLKDNTHVDGDTASNTYYFVLDTNELKFYGDAKCSRDGTPAIDVSSLTWKLYSGTGIASGLKQTKTGVNPVVFSKSDIGTTPGTYTIALTATDEYGTSDTVWSQFYYAHPLPTITSPVNSTKLTEAPVNVTFTAGTENPSYTTKSWKYCLGGIATYSVSTTPISFDIGTYTVSLVSTDSSGNEKVAVSNFVVNKNPTVAISSPSTGNYYFGNQSLEFTGTAKKSNGDDLPAANITWYRSTSPTGTETKLGNGSSITVTPQAIGTGTWYIRLVGVDSDYPPNQTSSASIRITTGIDLPKITAPASGTRYDTGSSVSCIGNDLSSHNITMKWTYDENTTGPTGNTANFTELGRGWRTIKYSGEDSAHNVRTATTMVLMDKLPTFTLLPQIVSPEPHGDGIQKADGSFYKIILASEGTRLNYRVTAVDEIGDNIDTITWIDSSSKSVVDGSTDSPANFNINPSGPGSFTYTVYAEDIHGVKICATYSFWIWDCETYSDQLENPRTIINNGDNYLYVINQTSNNQINKFERKTAAIPSNTSGDISSVGSTIVASCTFAPFLSIQIRSSKLYSFCGNGAGSFALQDWNASNLEWPTDYTQETNFQGDLRDIPYSGFAMSDGYYFVSDRTNKRLVKLSNDGSFINATTIAMSDIGAVEYVNDNEIFVACPGDNRVYKLKSNNNTVAGWVSNSLPDSAAPSGMVYSNNTHRLYVVSATAPKIYVLDGQTGSLLYSFGKASSSPVSHKGEFKAPCDMAICGSNGTSDLYVTDSAGNCIVRFRSGVSW